MMLVVLSQVFGERQVLYNLIYSRLPHVSARDLVRMLALSSLRALSLETPWLIEEGARAFFTIMNAEPLGLTNSGQTCCHIKESFKRSN